MDRSEWKLTIDALKPDLRYQSPITFCCCIYFSFHFFLTYLPHLFVPLVGSSEFHI
jgi:hypothetical protein